jgi:hypothetical protein
MESINQGTGAGGVQTNKNGKKWENDTCNKNRLLSQGYLYELGILQKKYETHEILYFAQGDLKRYFKGIRVADSIKLALPTSKNITTSQYIEIPMKHI